MKGDRLARSVGNDPSLLDPHTPYIVVPAKISSVSLSAEPVGKVQMANFGNFDIVKNQQLTGRRIEQKSQILGFSTGSLVRQERMLI